MADTAIPPAVPAKERKPKLVARFVLRLDDTTYGVLRDFAHREHVSMTVVVRDAVRAYLKDHL